MPDDSKQTVYLDPNDSMENKRAQLVQMIKQMDRPRRISFVNAAIKDMKTSGVPGDKEFAERLQFEFLGGLAEDDLLK